MAAFVFPVNFAAGALRASPGTVRSFMLRETAGAVAAVRLWDNASAASGTKVATVSLPANGSFAFAWPGDGCRLANGLFAEVVSGTVEGSVHF